ncbi:large conductance mechanosensitive channel protein MscL [Nocardia sp. 2]|uniref:Large-conductance mechanosensitive channel n=1 Tax=Nocardia acididurans TaxID=2802282 RepID=A0ABS1M2B4_9NOCA|nr:large conductance mechanosensitive channel protein MscL [Nocardia acididurans]MBL1074797.1 large conductance mechanosensitive channel protein MscL [Nocardia acididurans]
MFKGFKEFLMRGNVVDLAIAVVIGAAFTAIVTSITKGLLEPLLAVLGGNAEFGFGFQILAGKPSTFVALGPIISATINFILVAAVLYFVLIVPMNHLKQRLSKPTEVKADPTELELLMEIRDLLAAQKTERESAIVRGEATTTETLRS